jgi:hypothetical protein
VTADRDDSVRDDDRGQIATSPECKVVDDGDPAADADGRESHNEQRQIRR